ARDEATGGVVALKTALQVKESSLSSIRREVEALRRLRHPGIVRILESGVDAGRPGTPWRSWPAPRWPRASTPARAAAAPTRAPCTSPPARARRGRHGGPRGTATA